MPRRKTLRPSVGPKSSSGGVAAGASPAQLRALGIANTNKTSEGKRMDDQRLRIEKLRREAIKNKLKK